MTATGRAPSVQESTIADPDPSQPNTAEIHTALRRLDRRDWWLWVSAVVILLLLAATVFSFSLRHPLDTPATVRNTDIEMDVAVHGLFGLVLLFCVFAIYQQVLIKRLRSRLSIQIAMMSALQTRAEMFEGLAILDSLTGLFNRRFAAQHLPVELARAERHGYPFTLLMLDLNELKQVNDTFGHAAGDLVLRQFARHLKKAVRSSDIPVRWGGDEFMILLPECRAYGVPDVLLRLSGLEAEFEGHHIPITAAAGWAEYKEGTPEELIAQADQALYDDKLTGAAEQRVHQAAASQQYKQKMQVVGQLAGGVAHDFNNLLTVIRGYSELVFDALPEDDPLRQKISEVGKAAAHAASLTRQLLLFSRRHILQSNQLLDLNEVVGEVETVLRPLVGARMNLETRKQPNLGAVRADPQQVEQVLMNLAVNARDATPEGGTIVIESANAELDADYALAHPGSRPGSYVMLKVSDYGTGMDADTKAHIFDPFFTTKGDGQGSGIGLTTVYGIVKQIGGYIWVDSEPGQGTTFSIYFPRFTEKLEIPSPKTAEEPGLAFAKDGHTVLVVETVQAVRDLTCEYLRLERFQVLEAADGFAALQAAETYQGKIHLALIDTMLPGMSCRELARHLVSRDPQMKIVYVSGSAEDLDTCADVLARDAVLLQKPFSPAELTQQLQDLLT